MSNKELSTPAIVAAIIVVLLVVGGIAWKVFGANNSSSPIGNLSTDQQAAKIKAFREQHKERGIMGGNPSTSSNAGGTP